MTLREGFKDMGKLFGGTVPPNNTLFGGTVPPNSTLFGGTPDSENDVLFNEKFLTLWMQECKYSGMKYK